MKRNHTLVLAAVSSLALLSAVTAEESSSVEQRVYAYLQIHDVASALRESRRGVELFPESKQMHIALIRSLCEKGEELEAIDRFNRLVIAYPEEKENRELLEHIAWGVLGNADRSSLWMVRLYGIIGASITRDVRAVPLLLDALRDPNAYLRTIAIQFATQMRDQLLQKELLRMLQEEKVWHVRLVLLEAAGSLQMREAIPFLKKIIANAKTSAEEKEVAISALVTILDQVEEAELHALLASSRAGLRELACNLIAHFNCTAEAKEVVNLLQDPSPSVRIAAINALALLRVVRVDGKGSVEWIAPLLDDGHPEVAITAAWATVLFNEEEGEKRLGMWLQNKQPALRRLAAAAVKALGGRGSAIAAREVEHADDLYVKMNLSIALIGQRKELDKAPKMLFQALMETKDLWMWDSSLNPLFRRVAPSTVRHSEQLANYPYVVDQTMRLEFLSLLTHFNREKALEAVKAFLHHQSGQVSGAAAFTLLSNGGKEAMTVVKQLLGDKDEKIALEAAQLLALFRRDPEAIAQLQKVYPQVCREDKLRILETLGHLGDEKLAPFFLERLQEPYQTLRVAAASCLIQSIYH